ncbi:MAG: hypothetical protein E6G89_11805 [Alphaproteobacteria bacterium]|nr:MAG: hypothetical protein E6G89_11805 [Alphaproteobacteria bacterium]
MPHDVKNREWGAAGRARALTLMGFGVKPIRVGAAVGPAERINAARVLLPKMRFNRTPRRRNESMQTFSGPLHDDNSHGADAFGEYAVNCGLIAPKPRLAEQKPARQGTVFLPGPPMDRPSKRTRT